MTWPLKSVNLAAILIATCALATFWPSQAMALMPDYEPTAATYVVYTFCGCGLLFLALITIILRAYRWLHYVVLAAAQVLTQAGVSGALPYWLGGSDFVTYVVPYLIISLSTSIGYYVAGSQLESPHPFIRYRKACYAVAVISAIGPLTSYFWLMKIPLNLMWVPQLVMFYSMYAVLILPAWTWVTDTLAQKLITRSFPLVTGLPFILMPFFEEPGYILIGTVARWLEFFGMCASFFYVWVLAIWLGVSGQTARLAAERKALEVSKNEAELQLALRDAERDYQDAAALAQRSTQTLASVSHDLKQPLTSLRMAVEKLESNDAGADSASLGRAVDYVEGLAQAYVGKLAQDDALSVNAGELQNPVDSETAEIDHSTPEPIQAQVLLDSLQQLLGDQAQRQGVSLSINPSEVTLKVAPLDAMRVLSNLLSNALQHAQASNLVLTLTPKDNVGTIVITDNGKGMTSTELNQMRLMGNKGTESSGDGLGLSIVADLCARHGWPLTIDSKLGRGTTIRLSMPLA